MASEFPGTDLPEHVIACLSRSWTPAYLKSEMAQKSAPTVHLMAFMDDRGLRFFPVCSWLSDNLLVNASAEMEVGAANGLDATCPDCQWLEEQQHEAGLGDDKNAQRNRALKEARVRSRRTNAGQ